MKTTGLFVGDIPMSLRKKIERAFHRAKPRVIAKCLQEYGTDPMEVGGSCLYWSAYGADELDKEGIETQLQGGTMFWRIVPSELQSDADPLQMFNYGYEYSYTNPYAIRNVLAGGIPEMHVWLAAVKEHVLIDMSICGIKPHFTHSAGAITGCKWLTPDPPPYLALKGGEYGEEEMGGHYFWHKPDSAACVIAVKAVRDCASEVSPSCVKVPAKMEEYVANATERYLYACAMKKKENDGAKREANRVLASVHQ